MRNPPSHDLELTMIQRPGNSKSRRCSKPAGRLWRTDVFDCKLDRFVETADRNRGGFVDDAKAFQSRINSSLPSEMENFQKSVTSKSSSLIIWGQRTDIKHQAAMASQTDGLLLVWTGTANEICKSPDEYYSGWSSPSRCPQLMAGDGRAAEQMRS